MTFNSLSLDAVGAWTALGAKHHAEHYPEPRRVRRMMRSLRSRGNILLYAGEEAHKRPQADSPPAASCWLRTEVEMRLLDGSVRGLEFWPMPTRGPR